MKKFIAILCAAALMITALCACSSDTGFSAKPLSDVFSEIKSAYDLGSVLEFTDVAMLDRYYGITAEEVSEFAGCISKQSTVQTEIVFIKAADMDAAYKIEEALQNKYSSKLYENKNYNPEQYDMIEDGKLERNGLYVSMVVAPDAEAINALYKSAVIP